MSVLMLAFYGEGNSDREFLPPLIQRTSDAILAHYAKKYSGNMGYQNN